MSKASSAASMGLAGAGAGAAAGSVVPGVGTLIGAGVGGLAGAIGGYLTGEDDELPQIPQGGYGNPDIGFGDQISDVGHYFGTKGMGMVKDANEYGDYAQGQSMTPIQGALKGVQAYENQDLSNREADTRSWDQSGSIQLAREAAMGDAPSEAAYQMQAGLDQSLAAQQAQMGGARGNAGIALASGNAAANSANLMNQTYNQAAALRANEMATARGLYGGLAGQMRKDDLTRLGLGNTMSQGNADRTLGYGLGMGQIANGAGANANDMLGTTMNPYKWNTDALLTGHQIASGSQGTNAGLSLDRGKTLGDWSRQDTANIQAGIGTAMTGLGNTINSMQTRGLGGSTIPNKQYYGMGSGPTTGTNPNAAGVPQPGTSTYPPKP